MTDRNFPDELRASTARVAIAREAEAAVWEDHKKLLKEAYASGVPYQTIATLTGVTKARAWQLITGRRPSKKDATE